jgi:hypothetical protein
MRGYSGRILRQKPKPPEMPVTLTQSPRVMRDSDTIIRMIDFISSPMTVADILYISEQRRLDNFI